MCNCPATLRYCARPDRYRDTIPHAHASADRNSGSHQHTYPDSFTYTRSYCSYY